MASSKCFSSFCMIFFRGTLVGQQIWQSGGVHEYLIKCLEDETHGFP